MGNASWVSMHVNAKCSVEAKYLNAVVKATICGQLWVYSWSNICQYLFLPQYKTYTYAQILSHKITSEYMRPLLVWRSCRLIQISGDSTHMSNKCGLPCFIDTISELEDNKEVMKATVRHLMDYAKCLLEAQKNAL